MLERIESKANRSKVWGERTQMLPGFSFDSNARPSDQLKGCTRNAFPRLEISGPRGTRMKWKG